MVESDILNGNTLISESHSTYNKYYYVPGQDVSFRVVTTITDGHQAMAVRGFVVNGYSFNAELVEGTTNKYYADITIKAGTEDNTLEVIPVYKNTHIMFMRDTNTGILTMALLHSAVGKEIPTLLLSLIILETDM